MMAEPQTYNFSGIADAPPPMDARGRPAVSSDLSETPSTVDKLNEMLGPLAHPQTLTDFARLLTMPVDSVKKALVGALTMHAAKSTAQAAIAPVVKGAVNAAAAVGDAVDPDVVGVISPRAGKVIQIAQKLRNARPAPAAPVSAPAPSVVTPTIGEAAEAPASAAPAAAPVAATNAIPDQKLLNALAIQARRVGMKLTPDMEQTAVAAVGNGATPEQAVRAFAPLAPAEAAPATWTPTKLTLTAEESKVAAKLLREGKTDADVKTAIETARAFQKRYGTPTPTAAQKKFPKGNRGAGGD